MCGRTERTRNRGVDTWAIAMTLYNRFYARKSMKKNHTFVSCSEGRRETELVAGSWGLG